MPIKSVKDYLDKGGHVCDCGNVRLFGEIAKCKEHTNVHTIRHMGFWRWLKIALKDPVWTIKRYFRLRTARKEANKAIEDWKTGRTKTLKSTPMVSMIKRK